MTKRKLAQVLGTDANLATASSRRSVKMAVIVHTILRITVATVVSARRSSITGRPNSPHRASILRRRLLATNVHRLDCHFLHQEDHQHTREGQGEEQRRAIVRMPLYVGPLLQVGVPDGHDQRGEQERDVGEVILPPDAGAQVVAMLHVPIDAALFAHERSA
eukprot:scaffold7340_cov266-Pinguiococcus_pyrenoidosus.AAC.51